MSYWEDAELQREQNMHDPELRAPVGLCWKCGAEIYSHADWDEYGGLCEDCWLEQEEEMAPAVEETAGAEE